MVVLVVVMMIIAVAIVVAVHYGCKKRGGVGILPQPNREEKDMVRGIFVNRKSVFNGVEYLLNACSALICSLRSQTARILLQPR